MHEEEANRGTQSRCNARGVPKEKSSSLRLVQGRLLASTLTMTIPWEVGSADAFNEKSGILSRSFCYWARLAKTAVRGGPAGGVVTAQS